MGMGVRVGGGDGDGGRGGDGDGGGDGGGGGSTYWVQGQGSFGSHGSRVNKCDPVSSLWHHTFS